MRQRARLLYQVKRHLLSLRLPSCKFQSKQSAGLGPLSTHIDKKIFSSKQTGCERAQWAYTHRHTICHCGVHTHILFRTAHSKRVQQQPPPLSRSVRKHIFISPGLTYCGLCEKVWMGRYWESVRAHEVMCNCTAQNKSIEWEEINMPASSGGGGGSGCSRFCAHTTHPLHQKLQLTKIPIFFPSTGFLGNRLIFSWFRVRKCGGLWVDGRGVSLHTGLKKGCSRRRAQRVWPDRRKGGAYSCGAYGSARPLLFWRPKTTPFRLMQSNTTHAARCKFIFKYRSLVYWQLLLPRCEIPAAKSSNWKLAKYFFNEGWNEFQQLQIEM